MLYYGEALEKDILEALSKGLLERPKWHSRTVKRDDNEVFSQDIHGVFQRHSLQS